MIFRNLIRPGQPTADISALADGSIAPNRRPQIERKIQASDELRSLFVRERVAAEVLRRARESDRASASLRRRLAGDRRPRTASVRRPLGALAAGLSAAMVAAGATAVLILGGGAAVGPSVAQAANLAARGPASPAPGVSPRNPMALSQRVGRVYFPNWSRTLGWSATGQRVDRIGAHRALTVYYTSPRQELAYTIVTVPALRQPRAQVVVARGLRLRALSLAGLHIVTWRRDGRTCVLSSREVPLHQLELLAPWTVS